MNTSRASQGQQAIAKYFEKKPILYIAGLSIVFKSTNVGILLSQLLYWQDKGKRKDGWIYKTMEEMRLETGLSRNQQDTAIKKLKEMGILEVKLKQIPAKRHFRINMQQLYELLPSLKASSNLTYPNPPHYFVENEQSITKITHETTSKNTEPLTLDKEDLNKYRAELVEKMKLSGGSRAP